MKKLVMVTLLLMVVRSLFVFAATPVPVLCFSDLVDGPKTGWEESPVKGCAVTIWGRNFGSTRGSNYVTVCGTDLKQNSDYAEWGVTANNTVGLERVTFWLNNNCTDGTGTIKITIDDINSNTLPFTVRSGNIYFVSKPDGSNSNNGMYASSKIGINGPFETLSHAKYQLSGGEIVYVRSGTYVTMDQYNSVLFISSQRSGSANNHTAFVGYPTEIPIIDTISSQTSSCIRNSYTDTGYIVLAKFKLLPYSGGIRLNDSPTGHYRIVGIEMDGQSTYPNHQVQSGAIGTDCVSDVDIFGCHIHHWGYNKYDHGIYVGTYDETRNSDNYDIGWNQLNNLGTDISGIYIHPKDIDYSVPQKYSDEIDIHDNFCYSLEHAGIHINSRVKDIRLYNNIIHDCGSASGRAPLIFSANIDTVSNILVYNNTIYSAGNSVIIGCGYDSNIVMKNNVVYSLSSTDYYSTSHYTGTRSSDYDVWYGNGVSPSWATNAITITDGNSLFVNASNDDFHLKDESPARDRGTSAVRSIVSRDFDGVLRTPNPTSKFDIGAYEWAEEYLPLSAENVDNLSNVKVAPNPFKPGRGDNIIRFTNLIGNPEIKIYTVSGELVKKISKEEIGSNLTVEWDVRNAQGEEVVSGVYVYLVTNEQGEKKYGKISIIK